MAKTSGGIRNSPRRQDGAPNGATEKGYTPKMARNITLAEGTIRNNRDESMFVFSSDGDLVRTFAGKGAQVKYDASKVRSIGQKGVKAIGNSFSGDDIVSAVRTNAKEIRAVTPTYTFSMKRPKGGWGASPKEVRNAYETAKREVDIEMKRYFANVGETNISYDRANATFYHKVMQKMSKQYGWIYSKKRG